MSRSEKLWLIRDDTLGETVLVNAAAGGVGIAAVQLAKGACFHISSLVTHSRRVALGAIVIAAAGSQAKLDICKRYGGADHVVDYSASDWQKKVMEITNNKGVDVVYDPVGRIQGK